MHAGFSKMALSFPGTEDAPHFDRTAFRVIKKRIFATFHKDSNTANIKLSPEDQRVFCQYNEKAIFQIPNKWGLKGWTTFRLQEVPDELIFEALNAAYKDILKPS